MNKKNLIENGVEKVNKRFREVKKKVYENYLPFKKESW